MNAKEIKDMMKMCGMNYREFADYFRIPFKTVDNWLKPPTSSRYRKCPVYLRELMEYKLRKEGLIKDEPEKKAEEDVIIFIDTETISEEELLAGDSYDAEDSDV